MIPLNLVTKQNQTHRLPEGAFGCPREGRGEGEINSMKGDKEGGQELRWELGVQGLGYLVEHSRGWDGRKKNPPKGGSK